MSRTRQFSIFLLKEGFDSTNSLKEHNHLDEEFPANSLPAESKLYVLDSPPYEPWWHEYFDVQKPILQASKGAIIFIPTQNRCFALSFGHVAHNLKDNSYEYDFGIRVTLNSLDPKKLKSADTVEPGAARRRRTQVPSAADLTFLDFDSNIEIIKSLTGQVKDELVEIFKSATGSTSLKIGLKNPPHELPTICNTLLNLYQSEEYLTNFPSIGKISPERDPDVTTPLDDLLLEKFKNHSEDIYLSIPDVVDYRDNICCKFHGKAGRSEIYPDVSLEALYEYLGDDFDYENLTLDELKSVSLILCDAEGRPTKTYSIYNAILADIDCHGRTFHMCEGSWYQIEQEYLKSLNDYLDLKIEATDLITYNHDEINDGHRLYSEENYNAAIPLNSVEYICLDQTNIAPTGTTKIEPCDLFAPQAYDNGENIAKLYHIKISTRSSSLSHLFNQGVNSAELILLEEQCRENLKALITEKIGQNSLQQYHALIDQKKLKIIYAIITRKPIQNLSSNLPLFSKLSLRRCFRALDLMQLPCCLTYISDTSPAKEKYSEIPTIIVELVENNGKKEAVVAAGQNIEHGTKVKRCRANMLENPAGSRFKLHYKINKDGEPYSSHKWNFEILQ